MYSYGSPHMAAQKQDDQLERTFSSYVRIQDVVLKTYLGRWTIGRSGERGSGISVLPARYDDADDDSGLCFFLSVFIFRFHLFFFLSNTFFLSFFLHHFLSTLCLLLLTFVYFYFDSFIICFFFLFSFFQNPFL